MSDPVQLLFGTTRSHEDQLKTALASLRSHGGVAPNRWTVLLSGNSEETSSMRGSLNQEFPGIQTIEVDAKASEFGFLKPALERGLHALYFDYLRAWAAPRLASPYLWIDSDVLVRDRLMLEGLPYDAPIAMAADFPTQGIPHSDFHLRMSMTYRKMLTVWGKNEVTRMQDSEGNPQNMNCGVLFINQPNIDRLWREAFEACLSILPDYVRLIAPPSKYAAGAENTFGQGIWNVLYAGLGGAELEWRWNNLKMAFPARQGMVDHYAVDKEAFAKDASSLGFMKVSKND